MLCARSASTSERLRNPLEPVQQLSNGAARVVEKDRVAVRLEVAATDWQRLWFADGGFVEQPETDQRRPMLLRPSHAEFEGRAAIR
jgi:hypothetical protein